MDPNCDSCGDDTKSTTSSDSPTTDAFPTPPESVATVRHRKSSSCHIKLDIGYSIPLPGSCYIIKSLSTRQVITLLDGKIALQLPGSNKGSIHWVIEEKGGWLGFRNPASGKYMGDLGEGLCCFVGHHQTCEKFCVRMDNSGKGFVLLMINSEIEELWPVVNDGGCLRKMGKNVEDGVVWGFVKVD